MALSRTSCARTADSAWCADQFQMRSDRWRSGGHRRSMWRADLRVVFGWRAELASIVNR